MTSLPSNKTRTFQVEARTILHLGRESIRDPSTAIVELVKNAYDADATAILIEIFSPPSDTTAIPGVVTGEEPKRISSETNGSIYPGHLRITDNGHGMTDDDLTQKWMVIGSSEKRKNTRSAQNRRVTGEKGIGRLSCDRLGANLELRSSTESSTSTGLNINWSNFEDSGVILSTIEIPTLDDPGIAQPAAWPSSESLKTGTQLTISSLRADWSTHTVNKLCRDLSILFPPWDSDMNFKIIVWTDIPGARTGVVNTSFDVVADVDVELELNGEDVTYILRTWSDELKAYSERVTEIKWSHLVQLPLSAGALDPHRLGRTKLRLLLVPRRPQSAKRSRITALELKSFMDQNTGVRIYRDKVRVRPYGDPDSPEGDWLGLAARKTQNPAGPSRPDFRVSPNQVIGAVFIGRDTNPTITDIASREGFLESIEFSTLRAFGIGSIRLLESCYHEVFKETKLEKSPEPEADPTEAISEAIEQIGQLSISITDPTSEVSSVEGKRSTSKKLVRIAQDLEETKKLLLDLLSEAGTLRGLSTIGIASSTFGHEVRSSISQVLASGETAKLALERLPPKIAVAISEVDKINSHADRLNTWSAFALDRVRRDKRQRDVVQIDEIVDGVIVAMAPMLKASGVRVDSDLAPCRAKVFVMDIETIVVNLLTNAYSALRVYNSNREIFVQVVPAIKFGRDGVEIAVADSGPGVADEFIDRVWRPLFTTKVDDRGMAIGTGLGLSIVDSIVNEARGERSIMNGDVLSGATFRVWIPGVV